MTLSAAKRERGIFIEQAFAPGSASTSRRITINRPVAMSVALCMLFSCSTTSNLTLSRTLPCGVGFLRHFIYSNLLLGCRNDTALTSPTSYPSAQLSLRRLISVFQTTSWLIIYLDRDVYAPNAVLQQPFFSSLSTIFGSVGCMRFVFLVAPKNRECTIVTLRSLQFITLAALFLAKCFSHLILYRQG